MTKGLKSKKDRRRSKRNAQAESSSSEEEVKQESQSQGPEPEEPLPGQMEEQDPQPSQPENDRSDDSPKDDSPSGGSPKDDPDSSFEKAKKVQKKREEKAKSKEPPPDRSQPFGDSDESDQPKRKRRRRKVADSPDEEVEEEAGEVNQAVSVSGSKPRTRPSSKPKKKQIFSGGSDDEEFIPPEKPEKEEPYQAQQAKGRGGRGRKKRTNQPITIRTFLNKANNKQEESVGEPGSKPAEVQPEPSAKSSEQAPLTEAKSSSPPNDPPARNSPPRQEQPDEQQVEEQVEKQEIFTFGGSNFDFGNDFDTETLLSEAKAAPKKKRRGRPPKHQASFNPARSLFEKPRAGPAQEAEPRRNQPEGSDKKEASPFPEESKGENEQPSDDPSKDDDQEEFNPAHLSDVCNSDVDDDKVVEPEATSQRGQTKSTLSRLKRLHGRQQEQKKNPSIKRDPAFEKELTRLKKENMFIDNLPNDKFQLWTLYKDIKSKIQQLEIEFFIEEDEYELQESDMKDKPTDDPAEHNLRIEKLKKSKQIQAFWSIPLSIDVRHRHLFENLARLQKKYANKMFDVITCDPPWQLSTANPTRGVAIAYDSLSDKDIMHLPFDLLQERGFLFIWVINAKYGFAIQLFNKYGYTMVDEIVWVKQTVNAKIAKGHGFYLQHAKETCLVGVKGDIKPEVYSNIMTDVIFSQRRGQSQKPEEIYDLAEALMPNGHYLEIFGRRNNLHDGWVTIGNEL